MSLTREDLYACILDLHHPLQRIATALEALLEEHGRQSEIALTGQRQATATPPPSHHHPPRTTATAARTILRAVETDDPLSLQAPDHESYDALHIAISQLDEITRRNPPT